MLLQQGREFSMSGSVATCRLDTTMLCFETLTAGRTLVVHDVTPRENVPAE